MKLSSNETHYVNRNQITEVLQLRFARLSRESTVNENARKNLLMLRGFLMGCFPEDFQEGKRPIKAFGETAHQGRKMAHQGGETPH